jgi:hypothetical protein
MQPRRTMPKKFSTWILNRIARFKLWTENCTSILGFAAVKFAALQLSFGRLHVLTDSH